MLVAMSKIKFEMIDIFLITLFFGFDFPPSTPYGGNLGNIFISYSMRSRSNVFVNDLAFCMSHNGFTSVQHQGIVGVTEENWVNITITFS